MAMVIPRPGTTVEEVHCHNKTTDDAVTLIIDSSYDTVTCKIPDTFLTTSNDLVFYAVMKDDTGKYTTEKALFKVIKRPKPSDYVYTDDDVKTWDQLSDRIKEIEEELEDLSLQEKDLTDYDAIKLATDLGLVELIMSHDGFVYTDENGNLYSL